MPNLPTFNASLAAINRLDAALTRKYPDLAALSATDRYLANLKGYLRAVIKADEDEQRRLAAESETQTALDTLIP
jgi:hypothetical protein